MQIKCPNCNFAREVDESQIPANSSFATCPKCATRFRFRADPAPEAVPAEENGSAAPSTPEATSAHTGKDEHEDDIWASMDKMRLDWDKIEDAEENEQEPKHSAGKQAGQKPWHDKTEQEDARRREAQRAYQQAASQAGRGVPFFSSLGSVPWEYRGGFLHPIVLFRTILLIATRMPQFFSGINPFSSIFPAWLFMLFARSVQMVVGITTSLVYILPDGTQQSISMIESFGVVQSVVISVCMISMVHFLGSFIVNYTIQLHSGAKANFRLTFKVMSYASMPLILAAIPGAGGILGMVASLFLLFFGIRYAYAFSWRKTMISIMPYLLLSLLFLMMLIQAATGGIA